MRERPILMSAPMVRACLDGSKTQTRRIAPVESFDIKPAGNEMVTWAIKFSKATGHSRSLASYSGGRYTADDASRIVASQFCPYGKPGDRLWVREAWQESQFPGERGQIFYRADGETGEPWKPSIHMFRRTSRIDLEITGVRIERLQDISEADAKAEGTNFITTRVPTHKHAYSYLWDDINGIGAWDKNPWVWVVEFKRVKP